MNSAHLDSSSNPFSINLSNIPPVSMAITKSISSSTSLNFSSSRYGNPISESPTSSLQFIVIHSPLLFLSSTVMLPMILAPSSSGLSLKSLRHFVNISRSSAKLLLSFCEPNLPLPHLRRYSTSPNVEDFRVNHLLNEFCDVKSPQQLSSRPSLVASLTVLLFPYLKTQVLSKEILLFDRTGRVILGVAPCIYYASGFLM